MERACKDCGETKPLEAFYRDKRREDGRDFYCKDCRDGRGLALRQSRAAARPPRVQPTEKRCPKCGLVKPVAEFYRGSGRCRACRTEDHREYVSRPEVAERIRQMERARQEGRRKRPPRREPIGPGFEVCTMCNRDLPLDAFHKHKLGRNGVNSVCKECNATLSRVRRADSAVRERENEQRRFRRFGLENGEYDRMLAAQGGCCAICRGTPLPGERRLHVDHDHATGKVRALLCGACNAGIGLFRDDQALLRRAIEYLDVYRGGSF